MKERVRMRKRERKNEKIRLYETCTTPSNILFVFLCECNYLLQTLASMTETHSVVYVHILINSIYLNVLGHGY